MVVERSLGEVRVSEDLGGGSAAGGVGGVVEADDPARFEFCDPEGSVVPCEGGGAAEGGGDDGILAESFGDGALTEDGFRLAVFCQFLSGTVAEDAVAVPVSDEELAGGGVDGHGAGGDEARVVGVAESGGEVLTVLKFRDGGEAGAGGEEAEGERQPERAGGMG